MYLLRWIICKCTEKRITINQQNCNLCVEVASKVWSFQLLLKHRLESTQFFAYLKVICGLRLFLFNSSFNFEWFTGTLVFVVLHNFIIVVRQQTEDSCISKHQTMKQLKFDYVMEWLSRDSERLLKKSVIEKKKRILFQFISVNLFLVWSFCMTIFLCVLLLKCVVIKIEQIDCSYFIQWFHCFKNGVIKTTTNTTSWHCNYYSGNTHSVPYCIVW